MPYDRELADRLRLSLGGEPGVSEKAMFGGLAFLVGGNMASYRLSARWGRSIWRRLNASSGFT